MTIKLRRCPFCGGASLGMDSRAVGDDVFNFVACRDCWAEGPSCRVTAGTDIDGETLAKLAWNGDRDLFRGKP